jgi:succinate dehydrogenase/fumarate reductase flavoprotein subunit
LSCLIYLIQLANSGYPFPFDDEGNPYRANLRGPDYMRFMRQRAIAAGVRILDHHPALELLWADGAIAGAAGIHPGEGRNAVRAREAAAMTATARWIWASAAARQES